MPKETLEAKKCRLSFGPAVGRTMVGFVCTGRVGAGEERACCACGGRTAGLGWAGRAGTAGRATGLGRTGRAGGVGRVGVSNGGRRSASLSPRSTTVCITCNKILSHKKLQKRIVTEQMK